MSTPSQNTETVRRYYEDAVADGQIDLLDDLVAADVVNHDPLSDDTLTPAEARGFEGFRRHVQVFQKAFPNGRFDIHDIVAEDDRVVVHFTMHGTHEGRFAGIDPSGNHVEIPSMVRYRVDEDGKLAERWQVTDDLSFLQQLDLLPDTDELLAKPA
jgi:steroid delta-isomerase-like uncharacterized protein